MERHHTHHGMNYRIWRTGEPGMFPWRWELDSSPMLRHHVGLFHTSGQALGEIGAIQGAEQAIDFIRDREALGKPSRNPIVGIFRFFSGRKAPRPQAARARSTRRRGLLFLTFRVLWRVIFYGSLILILLVVLLSLL